MISIKTIFFFVLGAHLAAADTAEKGVYVCSEDNWGGTCTWNHISYDNYKGCVPIDNQGKGIFGIGPDDGIWIQVFADKVCKDSTISSLAAPGYPNAMAYIKLEDGSSPNTIFVEAHDPAVDPRWHN